MDGDYTYTHWDAYTVFSVLTGLACLIFAAIGREARTRDRVLLAASGVGIAGYGIYVAQQTSGYFVFPAAIFLLPFALGAKVVFDIVQRKHRSGQSSEARTEQVVLPNRVVFGTRPGDQNQMPTQFRSPGAPAETLDAIVKRVNAYQEPPDFAPGLYLASRGTNNLVYRYGSKLKDSFEASVSIKEVRDDGCSGQISVTGSTETNGLVANADQLTQLRERIEFAMRDVTGASRAADAGGSGDRSSSQTPTGISAELANAGPPEGRGDQPSSGWYRDPLSGEHYRLRYWDGQAWTGRVD